MECEFTTDELVRRLQEIWHRLNCDIINYREKYDSQMAKMKITLEQKQRLVDTLLAEKEQLLSKIAKHRLKPKSNTLSGTISLCEFTNRNSSDSSKIQFGPHKVEFTKSAQLTPQSSATNTQYNSIAQASGQQCMSPRPKLIDFQHLSQLSNKLLNNVRKSVQKFKQFQRPSSSISTFNRQNNRKEEHSRPKQMNRQREKISLYCKQSQDSFSKAIEAKLGRRYAILESNTDVNQREVKQVKRNSIRHNKGKENVWEKITGDKVFPMRKVSVVAEWKEKTLRDFNFG